MGLASFRVLSARLPSGQIWDRAGLQRFFGLEDERQNFVIDLDVAQGFFGDVPIHGGDGGHRFAHEAHGIVEGVAALLGDLLDLIVVLAPARDGARAPHDGAVFMRENRFDAGHAPRPWKHRCCGCAHAGADCGARGRTACPRCTSPV